MSNENVRRAVRDVAPLIERTARLGFVSIGIVYLIVGLMTAAAAAGMGGQTAGWTDALRKVGTMPFGATALMVMAVGLFGYSVWLLISGITDSDGRGNDVKGIALRAGNVVSGFVHIAIAVAVVRLVTTHHSSSSGSDANAQQWTARVMEMPLGRVLVAVGGLTLIGYGLYRLVRAWEAKLGHRLHITDVPARPLLIAICRFGMAARALVVMVIGGSLVAAAFHQNPGRTHATKGALQWIDSVPFGRVLLFGVSAGLAAYGIYEIVKARYRTVRATAGA